MVKWAGDHQCINLRHLTTKSKTNISEVFHELAGYTAHIIVVYPAFRLSVDNSVWSAVKEIGEIASKNTAGFYAFDAKLLIESVQVPVQSVHSKVNAFAFQTCGVVKNK